MNCWGNARTLHTVRIFSVDHVGHRTNYHDDSTVIMAMLRKFLNFIMRSARQLFSSIGHCTRRVMHGPVAEGVAFVDYPEDADTESSLSSISDVDDLESEGSPTADYTFNPQSGEGACVRALVITERITIVFPPSSSDGDDDSLTDPYADLPDLLDSDDNIVHWRCNPQTGVEDSDVSITVTW